MYMQLIELHKQHSWGKRPRNATLHIGNYWPELSWKLGRELS